MPVIYRDSFRYFNSVVRLVKEARHNSAINKDQFHVCYTQLENNVMNNKLSSVFQYNGCLSLGI